MEEGNDGASTSGDVAIDEERSYTHVEQLGLDPPTRSEASRVALSGYVSVKSTVQAKRLTIWTNSGSRTAADLAAIANRELSGERDLRAETESD